jgi:molybdopterin converting factor small subunit
VVNSTLITCYVEFYGLSSELAGRKEVALKLQQDKAGIPDIVAALRKEAPALDGAVLKEGHNSLMDNQALNISGQFYHSDDDVILKDGDRIRILTMATGG